MSEAYRQKLLNWLISMMILCLCVALSLAAYWFFNRPDLMVRPAGVPFPDDYELVDYAGAMGEIVALFVVGFVPVALWHMADLFDRKTARSRLTRWLSHAAPYQLALLILGLLFAMHASGEFSYVAPCGGPMLVLSQDCYYTVPILRIPSTVAFWAVISLTILKVLIVATTRVRRRYD